MRFYAVLPARHGSDSRSTQMPIGMQGRNAVEDGKGLFLEAKRREECGLKKAEGKKLPQRHCSGWRRGHKWPEKERSRWDAVGTKQSGRLPMPTSTRCLDSEAAGEPPALSSLLQDAPHTNALRA